MWPKSFTMLAEKREKFKKIETEVGKIFARLGLTPNQYTLISLLLVAVSFYFLVNVRFVPALIFFVVAILLDFIDGAVARFSNSETKRGAYLDTICDRYVEAIILLGFLFLPLRKIIFPSTVWIFLAFFGSMMTTYAKAAAKEKEIVEKELKKGLLGRGERVVLILLALIFSIFNFAWTIYPIIILAIFSNITALQRIIITISISKKE